MKSLADTYTLAGGVTIPCVGFGTWQSAEGEVVTGAVREALAAGYRHIDTAAAYGNEAGVGRAVRQSGIPRGDVFITSKLANTAHGYDNTVAAIAATLAKLDCGYLDLYLIHWPNPISFRDDWRGHNAGSWRAMEEHVRAGKIRAIGISNFHQHHIDALLETADIAPAVNQIRLCPGQTQDDLVAYSRQKGMLLEAYSPLGLGSIFEVPEMVAMAEKYGRTIAQIAIRWSLQMGFLPLPKSVTPARIRQNAQVFDFTLADEDVAAIAALRGCCGEAKDPDTITF